VASPRTEPIDDDWGTIEATIAFQLPPEALAGLDTFSHVEVVYLFDRVNPDTVHTGARRPRGNPDWPEVGILAQRGKDRPNRIGICTAELVSVDGAAIAVRGLDAIDGTPVLDVKPYTREFGPRGEIRQPAWADAIMAGYF
jgi:tRNA-Thr(GGU) m(6)t(6)A37 methyltransferase TsaA